MNYEKQHGTPKRRPPEGVDTQSSKVGGRISLLPKLASSQAAKGSPALRVESKVENGLFGKSCQDDSGATPVKAFLSTNVTPRSGSRKARAENVSPSTKRTSNGTPSTSRPSSSYEHHAPAEDARATSGLGLRLSNAGRNSRTGSMVSDGTGSSVSSRPVLTERHNSFTRLTTPENNPKFFHADDVKLPIPPRVAPQQYQMQNRPPDQVPNKDDNYTNGRMSSMSNDSAWEEQQPRLLHARDHYESSSASPRLANGNVLNRPPLHTIYSERASNSSPRATSPLKEESKEEILPRKPSINKASPRRHTRLVSIGGSEIKSPEAISSGNGDLSRRSSLNAMTTARYSKHVVRSSSVRSTGHSPTRRSSIALSDISPVERARTTSLVGASGALPHSVNPPSTLQELPDSQLPSQPGSPSKSTAGGKSKIDQMNELAAKARRERKVLDLEISNSSLLAINRTLEREMRKQNAELRRFRRLSRSGRISIAPSSRSASGKMSLLSETGTSMASDDLVSSSDGEDDHAGPPSTVSSSSATSHPSSPTARAARARFQDPARIELDLTAHRALLLDSQKLNQSIKRCLCHSESLLSSGKRALAYQALAPGSENLGPRVLTPEEFESDIFSSGQGLLSPGLDQTVTNPWDQGSGSVEGLDGGLETPDYSKWGPPTAAPTPFAEAGNLGNGPSSRGTDFKDMDEPAQDVGIELDERSSLALEEEVRRPSMVASIDGLGDESDSGSTPSPYEQRPVLTTQGTNPDSYAARAERKEGMKPPDPRPGQPGYRGSMQNLGHYLQAFSIFGTSQQT